jgi:SAM-dependent methyltransferase
MAERDRYLLDNAQEPAGRRLAALAELFDPVTRAHVGRLGVGPGWHCWEVGAGGPSIPSWLAGLTAPGGRVLATDIDTSRLAGHDDAFEVRQHDVGREQMPPASFDLVHARLVLVHVTRREDALATMVDALRPGGWLLLEDADPALQPLLCPDEVGPRERLANQLRRGFRTMLAERGADLSFGRTLPRLLRGSALMEVGADAYFPITSPACAELEVATIEQLREQLLSGGLATEEELADHLRAVADGDLDLATAPMISAWGRKPLT